MGKKLSEHDIGYLIEPAVDVVWVNDGEGAQPSRFPKPFRSPAGIVTELGKVFPKADTLELKHFVKARTLLFCYETDPGFMDRVLETGRRDIKVADTAEENTKHYRKESDSILRTLTK